MILDLSPQKNAGKIIEIAAYLNSCHKKIEKEYYSCPADMFQGYIHSRHDEFPSSEFWKVVNVLHYKEPNRAERSKNVFPTLVKIFDESNIKRIAFSILNSDFEIPTHVDTINKDAYRLYYVLYSSGKSTLIIDNEVLNLKIGDAIVFNPGLQYHSAKNSSNDPRVSLLIDFLDTNQDYFDNKL